MSDFLGWVTSFIWIGIALMELRENIRLWRENENLQRRLREHEARWHP